WIATDAPPTLTAVKAIDNTPSPLNLPGDLASMTVPLTPARAGIATTPPTTTACASEPVKVSPGFAVFDVMLFLIRTTMLVPAGTTSGGGGGGSGACAISCAGAGVICCPCGGCCAGAICCPCGACCAGAIWLVAGWLPTGWLVVAGGLACVAAEVSLAGAPVFWL